MRNIETFSTDTENDKDILDHLAKQANKSKYIKELIRKDMRNKAIFSKLEVDEIKRIIQLYLDENEIAIDKTDKKESFDNDAINALEQFN